MRKGTMNLGYALVTAAVLTVLGSCRDGRELPSYLPRTGGNASAGAVIIAQKGCGSCHTIPGIRGARGLVGPPLLYFSRRTMIAGELPNTPENLVSWIRSPQSVEANTAMPNLGLTDKEARNVTAYLYTLR
jgi:cytochrome c1